MLFPFPDKLSVQLPSDSRVSIKRYRVRVHWHVCGSGLEALRPRQPSIPVLPSDAKCLICAGRRNISAC